MTCGTGVQTRLVHCIDEATQELSEGCNNALKPVSRKSCTNTSCPTPGIVYMYIQTSMHIYVQCKTCQKFEHWANESSRILAA